MRSIFVPILIAAALFGVLEAVFSALDLGRGRRLFVDGGHRRDVQYIVASEEKPGWWRTQFGSKKFAEISIAPKGEAKRFVFLGASNTRSFASHLAEVQLEQASGGSPWEVVNLGRGGYGSERVMMIALEVLEKLQPDALLVYTGDNDFNDRAGFGSSSILIPDTREDLRLFGSRTIGLLRELIASGAGNKPEAWVPPPPQRLMMLSLEDTRRHQAHLGDNLEVILAAAQAKQVHVVLLTVLYNRFYPPSSWSRFPSCSAAEKLSLGTLLEEIEELIPSSLRRVMTYPADAIGAGDWGRVKEEPDVLPDIDPLSWRRPTLEPLAGFFHLNRQPWEWAPAVVETIESLGALKARNFNAQDQANLERMEVLLGELLERVPSHPRAHWLMGLVKLALGRELPVIERHLVLAADHDRAPNKANETINNIIREVAEAHPEVLFLDMDTRIAGLTPGSTLGFEWMLDNCHISLGARTLLLQEVAEAYCDRWPAE